MKNKSDDHLFLILNGLVDIVLSSHMVFHDSFISKGCVTDFAHSCLNVPVLGLHVSVHRGLIVEHLVAVLTLGLT